MLHGTNLLQKLKNQWSKVANTWFENLKFFMN